jgi:oligopeptide/dipeptide ABC transporter ATP-binding protein
LPETVDDGGDPKTFSPLLSISNLSVKYGESSRNALDSVSLSIPSSAYTIGVVGESGSGKTTMGLAIMDLIEPPGKIVDGQVNYMGRNVLTMKAWEQRKYRWQEVAMVYQSAMNALNPVKTISDHIFEVLRVHARISKDEARDKAISLLNQVGIKTERANAYSHELSGGMRQRAVIAMALALSPKLLIADEPTSALDVVVQRQILNLLIKNVKDSGLSLVFITHEIALLEGLVDYVSVMFAGEVVEQGELGKVLSEPLHPYTQMLLSSLLTLDAKRETLSSLPLTMTKESHIIPENGCRFANRCIYAFERCRVERPRLKETEVGRFVACHKYNN